MEERQFLLIEIDTREYYKGKTYKKNNGTYPVVTSYLDEAKIFNKQGVAFRSCNSLNDKCEFSQFEVMPLDYIKEGLPSDFSETTENSIIDKDEILCLNNEFSLPEKIEYINGLADRDPTLNMLISLENQGMGHISVTEILDSMATNTKVALPNKQRSLIIE